jgi:hypothetical protein
VTDQTLQDKLTSVTPDVISKSDDFVRVMEIGDGHGFKKEDYAVPPVSGLEMKQLYEEQFALEASIGRKEYLAIRDLAVWCPACNHEEAEQADHFLPKGKFAALTVTPENLTPICGRCNRAKGAGFVSTAATAYVHPYFDDFEGSIWLAASVVPTPVAHVEFHVDTAGRTSREVSRIEQHLRRFKLKRFYGLQANKTAANARRDLERHWGGHDHLAVRAECEWNAASFRDVNLNSWEAATWTAFGESDWFCAGGFLEF